MAKEGVYYQLVVSQQGGDEKKKAKLTSLDDDEPAPDYEEDEELTKGEKWVSEEKEDLAETVSLAGAHPLGRGSSIRKRSTRSSKVSSSLPVVIEEEPEPFERDVKLMEIMKMNSPEWPYILLGVVGSFIVGLSTPIYAILFSNVLGVLTPGGTPEEQAQKREEGNFYSLMFLVLGIVVGFAAFAQSFAFSVAGESLTSRLRGLSFQAILKQEIGFFDDEKNSVGSLCARLSGDAASVQGATGSRIGVVFQAASTMIASIVLSMIFEWKLGLTALSFVPLLLIATYFQAKIIMGQSALERDALQKSASIAMEAISNIRTVAGLGKEQTFHDIYMDSLRGPHQAALRKSWLVNNSRILPAIFRIIYPFWLM